MQIANENTCSPLQYKSLTTTGKQTPAAPCIEIAMTRLVYNNTDNPYQFYINTLPQGRQQTND